MEDNPKEAFPPPPPQPGEKEMESITPQNPCFPSMASKIQKKPPEPQPPLPSNNWGGASPLLSQNIPPESLDVPYEKLDNTVRVVDCPQGAAVSYPPPNSAQEKEKAQDQQPKGKKEKTESGSKKWLRLPKLDPKNRWPQGWC